MNRIFSVALVYCDKMSTIASLGIRMLCGQPVFLILKSRKSYFRCNSLLSSDYYRYEIYDFQTMVNLILEMTIQKLELWNLKSEFRNQKSEIRNRKSQSLKIWNPQLRNQKSKAWFPKCHLWYPILTITAYSSLRCHYFEYRISKIVHISPPGVGRQIFNVTSGIVFLSGGRVTIF